MAPENNGKKMFINDQYFTVRKIGQGGFGIVWKAYDFSLRNFVAIKELLDQFTEQKYIEMFYKEALIAKNIIHDNIVRVQHFWKGTNNHYYMVMDYVSGDDLEDLLKKCKEQNVKLPWQIALLITGNILKAIDYANRVAKDPITRKPLGIVYRDISPGNILISFEGNVQLSDFGIAKTADEISCQIKRRIVTGKYAYMSPEQIECDPGIDHRSDIFSVGVVLYEMLSGKPLYTGTNEEIRKQVLETKFDPKLLEHLNLPHGLIDICAKALQKKKEDRYEKAVEMFRDIRVFWKFKETEEIDQELASFLNKILTEKREAEKEAINFVKELNPQDIRIDPEVQKFSCKDFIMGELPKEEDIIEPAKEIKEAEESAPAEKAREAGEYEEKGKTVFEEVGDWFINQFIAYKKMIIRGFVTFLVAAILFAALDFFLQITPFGKFAFSFLYPPDVVITTVPSGAMVSIKTREGRTVVSDKDSTVPIQLRKIPARTYIVTAVKKGFKPSERVVRIEEQVKGSRRKIQNIELLFDFMLRVSADIDGASVYIDGNKVGFSTWTGTITSGEHTVKLSAPGFEDLGSVAKENRDGQCSIDFTKPNITQMFANVDQRYWKYEMLNQNDTAIFALTGTMVKKVTVITIPERMVLHIKNESKDRGKTPIAVSLKSGEYLLRFMDPEGKFAETTGTLVVGKGSADSAKYPLKKWVTLKAKAKGNIGGSVSTAALITGGGVNIRGVVSTGKPLRAALFPGSYNFSFAGSRQFEPYSAKDVDISKRSVIIAEMRYKKVPITVSVSDIQTKNPVAEASIWAKDRLLGKTNASGNWEALIEYGTTTFSVVARGYADKDINERLKPGEKKEIKVELSPAEVSTSTASVPLSLAVPVQEPSRLSVFKNSLEQMSSTVGKAVGTSVGLTTGKDVPETLSKDAIRVVVTKSTQTAKVPLKEITVTCPNCGAVYHVSPSKKLRFCTNCGKPLRY